MRLPARATRQSGLLAVCASVSATPAQAHLVATGIGPVFDGIAHSIVSVEDALAMAAVAVLASLSGKAAARAAVIVYPLAWPAGALMGMAMGSVAIQPWLSIVTFMGLGLAIAAQLKFGPIVVAIIALLVASCFGLAAATDLARLPSPAQFLFGSTLAMTIEIVLITAVALLLATGWTLIAIRAVGSWLAAAGLLLLGWTLRGLA
jgi:urease accessory protein